jgi:hypothetical protein
VLLLVQSFESPIADSEISRIVSLAEHLAVAAAVFLGLARLFDSEEVHLVVTLLVKRQRPPDFVSLP